MPYSQKYTPPHCFFCNFAGWVITKLYVCVYFHIQNRKRKRTDDNVGIDRPSKVNWSIFNAYFYKMVTRKYVFKQKPKWFFSPNVWPLCVSIKGLKPSLRSVSSVGRALHLSNTSPWYSANRKMDTLPH